MSRKGGPVPHSPRKSGEAAVNESGEGCGSRSTFDDLPFEQRSRCGWSPPPWLGMLIALEVVLFLTLSWLILNENDLELPNKENRQLPTNAIYSEPPPAFSRDQGPPPNEKGWY